MSDMSKIIVTGIACLALGAVGGNYLPALNSSTSNKTDSEEVKTIVANYIADNPERIIESLQNFQAKAASKQQAESNASIKDNMPALLDDSNSPTVGTGTSGITLVEFFDYRCGYCKRMADTMQKLLKVHPDVKVVMKEFPILSEGSQRAAQASLAISYLAPERYLDYHMMLMQHKGDYAQSDLNDYAGQVQVNIDDFQKEMNGPRVAKEIKAVAELASKLGIQGTPAVVIGEELIPGAVPFSELDKHVRALKENKG